MRMRIISYVDSRRITKKVDVYILFDIPIFLPDLHNVWSMVSDNYVSRDGSMEIEDISKRLLGEKLGYSKRFLEVGLLGLSTSSCPLSWKKKISLGKLRGLITSGYRYDFSYYLKSHPKNSVRRWERFSVLHDTTRDQELRFLRFIADHTIENREIMGKYALTKIEALELYLTYLDEGAYKRNILFN